MALGDAYADEWLNWEEREDITLRVLASPAGASTDQFDEYTVEAEGGGAKRRAIRRSEIIASQGRFTSANIVWLLPRANLFVGTDGAVVQPQINDQIVDAAGQSYSILEVQVGKYGQTFRCVCLLD